MQVLIVGSTTAPEFAGLLLALHSFVQSEGIESCHSIRELPENMDADLVVILQQLPDEFTQSELLTLIDRYPLGHLVVCYSPWCDSDGRTRQIWPHAVRVPLMDATNRLAQEIESIRNGRPSLPLTATREETFDCLLPSDLPESKLSRRLCILSTDSAFRNWIQEILQNADHQIDESLKPTTEGVIWDADPWSPNGRSQLALLMTECHAKTWIAMCGFPRRHEVHELLNAGISLVLPKILSSTELREGIESAFDTSSERDLTHSLHRRFHELA